jgi:cytochrome c556
MKKWIAALAMVFGVGLVLAADDKVPAVDEIMEKAHASKTGLRAKIGDEVKKPNPDWATVQKQAKEFVSLADALAKNEPPKGPKDSWQKLAKEYAEQVKELQKAVDKKDAKGVTAMNQKLNNNCMGCHDVHRD